MLNIRQFTYGLGLALMLWCEVAFSQEPLQVEFQDVEAHRISSRRLIHAELQARTSLDDAVTLQVTVDSTGHVLVAKSTDGPPKFFGQAEDLEGKQIFEPFQKDGHAVVASFKDYVSIAPIEQWGDANAPFPEIHDWNGLVMRLQRTSCYGTCPSYSVEVRGDGKIHYEGKEYVKVKGPVDETISREAVEGLLQAFKQAKYFSLKDEYRGMVTDIPTYTTSIHFDNVKKSVIDYYGLQIGMPEAARDVENAIDRIAGTKKWIKGN